MCRHLWSILCDVDCDNACAPFALQVASAVGEDLNLKSKLNVTLRGVEGTEINSREVNLTATDDLVFNSVSNSYAWFEWTEPHRMGHKLHLNLKWIWMDGWMEMFVYGW